MDLKSLLLVGLGSFVGGSLRYVSVFWIDRKADGDFPLSVLLVNALGSLLIGFLAPMYSKFGWNHGHAAPLMLSVGVLGGYTTFSTFSLHTLQLLQAGSFGLAAANAVLSFAVCLASVYLGLKLGQTVWGL